MDSRTEIDQIVKEAQEGVDTFGTLWYQVFDVDKAKKLKNAFRKQHSTLRRNRAKIDKLLMSTEFEDVEALLYSRELLDREMGRYKVIEEEIKTKVEPDPRETAVSETRNLIKTLVGEFTLEIGKFKAEMTTEGKTGKRPRSTYLEDTIASFESEVEKLSSLSQLDELSLQEVQGVKDLVKQRQKYLYDVINFLPSFPRGRVGVVNDYIRGYKVLKELGDGDYGTVFEVIEPTTSKIFALKVIPLENGQIKNTMAREISILYSMEENKVENIIRLKNAFFYKESICLVMELMPRTLAAILESRTVKISRNLVQKWVKQLIDGVAYLHDKEIIHRDINPKNILVDDDFNLKLADFGFARHLYKKAALTPEVWNAKYNAPEVLLGASNYGKPSDMWSIGCVFAAILLNPNLPFDITGRHVDAMYSGNKDKGYRYSILDAIFSELGTPQEELWKGWTKLPHYPHCGFPSYPVKAYNVPHGFDEEGGHMLQALLKVTQGNT